jgi:hypothetical protein
MSVLYFDEIKKKQSQEDWSKSYFADGAPPGVYVPNMSDGDALLWRAKQIGGKNPRIEIRKRLNCWVNVVVIVYPDESVKLSANGKMEFTPNEYRELITGIAQAKTLLRGEQ